MGFRKLFFSCGLSLIPIGLAAQMLGPSSEKRLRNHVYYLASDKLEGRLPGSVGCEQAAQYIAKHFRKAGLQPAGDSLWYQYFLLPPSPADWQVSLLYNDKPYPDFKGYALPYSGEGTAKGPVYYMAQPDTVQRMSLEGYVLVLELKPIATQAAHNGHPNFQDMVRFAQQRGAVALVYVDNNGLNPTYGEFKLEDKFFSARIPCVFAGPYLSKTLADGGGQLTLSVRKSPPVRSANVIGFIDNGAPYTVVIGAHYDHLGTGHPGSRSEHQDQIHNGADDNASGTAGLLELARALKKLPYRRNNYLFIAFTAEESGLLGSAWFTRSNLFNKYTFNYMLNLDMIGRLNQNLAIQGVGTSPQWGNNINAIRTEGFTVKTSASGVGPSDHTSFYLKDIPVLHFFTGLHDDYHKPSDDPEKINYTGMRQVLNFILELIQLLNDQGRLQFERTQEANNTPAPRFKVTLGIIPDYMFDGRGVRVEGVQKGKPAEKAGLRSGDIIQAIGDHPTPDMPAYMKALSYFNAGDETTLKVERLGQIIALSVVF
ncbi:MAG: M20/M25/M40 family metallo-hydrolase [Flavobacteriales bacterium]|nr:M20/M25/M40 family metallo-hydrolase [Flavobacteriales bacterium]MDW8410982.1 M20/M25/M40 family metallo-hydrolase [Flavobacteriales bacterium]